MAFLQNGTTNDDGPSVDPNVLASQFFPDLDSIFPCDNLIIQSLWLSRQTTGFSALDIINA